MLLPNAKRLGELSCDRDFDSVNKRSVVCQARRNARSATLMNDERAGLFPLATAAQFLSGSEFLRWFVSVQKPAESA